MTSSSASRTRRPPRTVSRAHDPAERQADRAADVVARGGSVGGWAFGSVSLSAGVHRDGPDSTPKQDDDKRQAEIEQAAKDANATDGEKAVKGAAKVAEGIAATPAGKQAIQLVRARPDVASVEKFLGTPAGKIAVGGVAAVSLTGLAIAKQPMPFSVPAIPITPTLTLKPEISGPLNAPTGVTITLSYKGTSGAAAKDPNSKEAIAADIARIKKDNAWLTDAVQRAREAEGGGGTAGGAVQREPATATESASEPHSWLSATGVDEAIASGGRPLDAALRHSMEARFRADFSGVRLHDGARASDAAAHLDATAFTVGEDIAFAGSIPDASTYEGRHLLAHELAHVVQQRSVPRGGGFTARVHRRSVGEWLGIFFGATEGDWTDQELRSYLDALTATDKIDGAFDADNKARAIVRKWKAATPGWDISGRQKGLLIDEMLDGPTGDDDEDAILDLLERSDAGDLRTIFARPKQRWERLDADLDWSQHDRLLTFVKKRFKGGKAALADGKTDIADVVILGDVVPAGAPAFAFDSGRLETRLSGDDTADEIIAIIERLSPADRQKATDHLLHVTLGSVMDERGRAAMSYLDSAGDRKEELRVQLVGLNAKLRKLKRIIPRLLLGEVPATGAELKATTKALPADKAKAVRDILAPKQYDPLDEDQIEILPADEAEEADEKAPAAAAGKAPDSTSRTTPTTAADRRAAAAKKKAEEQRRKKEEDDKHGPKSKYRQEVEAAIVTIIADNYQSTVVDKGTHADPSLIEPMAEPAKNATDDVFGRFYSTGSHPALSTKAAPGKKTGIPSWHEKFTKKVGRLTDAQRVEAAFSWALYYARENNAVRLLNDKYDATPIFRSGGVPDNVAAKTLVTIARELVKDGVTKDPLDNPRTTADKLLATKRDWAGMSSGGKVYVDLYLPADRDEARLARWEMLQTLVHEYIHTLVADEYDAYAGTFGSDSTQYTTLIEGVDEVFTLMVWAKLASNAKDPKLREAVEGKTDAALPPLDVPPPSTYEAYAEAIRLVELVGIRNVMAAYFLGLVDRIRVPDPRGGRR